MRWQKTMWIDRWHFIIINNWCNDRVRSSFLLKNWTLLCIHIATTCLLSEPCQQFFIDTYNYICSIENDKKTYKFIHSYLFILSFRMGHSSVFWWKKEINCQEWIIFDRIYPIPYTNYTYSRVHISSDSLFSKIPKKPSILQKKMIPHIKAKGFFNGKKPKTKKKNWQKKLKN